jgi:hypothetical protein
MSTVSDILKEDGLRAFFLGSYPRLVRAVVSGAVQFASYEVTRNFLNQS